MNASDIVVGANTCVHRIREGGFCEACTARREAYMRGDCEKCFSRPATENFTMGGALDFVHGMFERWCRRCVIEAQIANCEEAAARLPNLYDELATLQQDGHSASAKET